MHSISVKGMSWNGNRRKKISLDGGRSEDDVWQNQHSEKPPSSLGPRGPARRHLFDTLHTILLALLHVLTYLLLSSVPHPLVPSALFFLQVCFFAHSVGYLS